MASKRPLRLLQSRSNQCICPNQRIISRRTFSATTPVQRTSEVDEQVHPPPRWQQTPKAMVAPVRINPLPTEGFHPVNDDPSKLDKVYRNLLGKGGDTLLSDETKWLAVTHKSFDHGRRGFNDRLTFLGKRIVDVQASLAILNSSTALPDTDGREIFEHSALAGLPGLTPESMEDVLSKRRLGRIGRHYRLDRVIRWTPRHAQHLIESGENSVIAGAIYAIVGALALERGGAAANTFIKDKILPTTII